MSKFDTKVARRTTATCSNVVWANDRVLAACDYIDELEARCEALIAERDAYKRAKQENDDRFMAECGQERARTKKIEARWLMIYEGACTERAEALARADKAEKECDEFKDKLKTALDKVLDLVGARDRFERERGEYRNLAHDKIVEVSRLEDQLSIAIEALEKQCQLPYSQGARAALAKLKGDNAKET